jgi:5-methylcytosine-specific restriction endonuclease McrA
MPGWKNVRKDPAYNTVEWRRARLACLKRANWQCQRKLPGCQGAASEANHRRGLANDPHHTDLEAICGECHKKVTSQQAKAARGIGTNPKPKRRTAW